MQCHFGYFWRLFFKWSIVHLLVNYVSEHSSMSDFCGTIKSSYSFQSLKNRIVIGLSFSNWLLLIMLPINVWFCFPSQNKWFRGSRRDLIWFYLRYSGQILSCYQQPSLQWTLMHFQFRQTQVFNLMCCKLIFMFLCDAV